MGGLVVGIGLSHGAFYMGHGVLCSQLNFLYIKLDTAATGLACPSSAATPVMWI